MEELIEAIKEIAQRPCPACGGLFYIASEDENGIGYECDFCYLRLSVYQADGPFEPLVKMSQDDMTKLIDGLAG
jgi:hypothetical protein